MILLLLITAIGVWFLMSVFGAILVQGPGRWSGKKVAGWLDRRKEENPAVKRLEESRRRIEQRH